jgi:hypothetical protein
VVNQGWQPHQIAAVMNALAEYTPITGIQYLQTTDVTQAEFRMITVSTATYGARFYPQDPAYGTQEGIGTFNLASGRLRGISAELGAGRLFLRRHPARVRPCARRGAPARHRRGVGDHAGRERRAGSLGVYNLNQGVYTVMSYNDAWQLHPDGASAFTVAGIDNGWSATLGAFDIAVLQARYGVHAHNTGDNVYNLTDIADDAFYQTIWDTGGTDTHRLWRHLQCPDRPDGGHARLHSDRRRRSLVPVQSAASRPDFHFGARRLHDRQRRRDRECFGRQRQ